QKRTFREGSVGVATDELVHYRFNPHVLCRGIFQLIKHAAARSPTVLGGAVDYAVAGDCHAAGQHSVGTALRERVKHLLFPSATLDRGQLEDRATSLETSCFSALVGRAVEIAQLVEDKLCARTEAIATARISAEVI